MVAAAVCVVGALAFLIVRTVDRGGGPDAAAFFAATTPRSCARGSLDLSLERAGFAASFDGEAPARGGKFLVATLAATNRAATQHAGLQSSFQLRDLDGSAVQAEGASGAWAALDAGATAEGMLAFGVPSDVGAARLIFDDGCSYQEWVVP